MEFPSDVCLLQADGKIKCPSCDGGWIECFECRGSGFNRSSNPKKCSYFSGSGWYNVEKQQGCFRWGEAFTIVERDYWVRRVPIAVDPDELFATNVEAARRLEYAGLSATLRPQNTS
jgi:hypothetical protein